MPATLAVFLAGDVMLGRGVDQILRHPGDPTLQEPYVRDARRYVELAEARNGTIRRPVDDAWPWGDALAVLRDLSPAVRVVNLETAVTQQGDFAPGKSVHYRMHPHNIGCLSALSPDVCALANNHVLDFGRGGLSDTLDTLAGARLRCAGAGANLHDASAPAIVPVGDGARAVLLACATRSSGIPPHWAATARRPGVHVVPGLSDRYADEIAALLASAKRPGDITMVSIHWGSNWGFEVPAEHRHFVHRLIDRGVDLVHGHSSHHPRPVEIYRGRLVLYGCGDFVDDYEGISAHEGFRADLVLMYIATLERATGRLAELCMVPMQIRRMRLHHASTTDRRWLRATLDAASRPYGARVDLARDDTLLARTT